jgi:hypothetical protein
MRLDEVGVRPDIVGLACAEVHATGAAVRLALFSQAATHGAYFQQARIQADAVHNQVFFRHGVGLLLAV